MAVVNECVMHMIFEGYKTIDMVGAWLLALVRLIPGVKGGLGLGWELGKGKVLRRVPLPGSPKAEVTIVIIVDGAQVLFSRRVERIVTKLTTRLAILQCVHRSSSRDFSLPPSLSASYPFVEAAQ